jgi:hypothetical protein
MTVKMEISVLTCTVSKAIFLFSLYCLCAIYVAFHLSSSLYCSSHYLFSFIGHSQLYKLCT